MVKIIKKISSLISYFGKKKITQIKLLVYFSKNEGLIGTPSIPNYKSFIRILESQNISSLTKIIERNTKICNIK